MCKFALCSATALLSTLPLVPAFALDQGSHLAQVGLSDELLDQQDGTGVTVAILDGTIDVNHAEFDDARQITFDGGTYTSPSLHGTHVAGIVGANRDGLGGQGIAPGVSLVGVGVFDDKGWVGKSFSTIFGTAVGAGASVANASYATTSNPFSAPGELAALGAVRNSLLYVRAAGNNGLTTGNLGYSGDAGALTNLIYVGSVNGSNQISSFSNRPGEACFGSRNCKEADKVKYRFLVAPGESVLSTAPGGYARLSGTSMATPVVTGAAALVQSRWEWLKTDPGKTADILFASATDLGAAGVDGVYGHGLLNVAAAMAPIGSPDVITDNPNNDTGGGTVTEPPAKGRKVKRRSRFAARNSALRSSSLLNRRLLGAMSVTSFDSFGRDFTSDASDFLVASDSATFVNRWRQRAASQRAQQNQPALVSLSFGRDGSFELGSGARDGLQLTAGFGDAPTLGLRSDELAEADLFVGGSTGHNAFAALAQGGLHAGARYQLGGKLSLSASYALKADDLSQTLAETGSFDLAGVDFGDSRQQAFSSTASYDFSDRFSGYASFTQLNEQGSLLGGAATGLFDFGDGLSSQAVTLGFNWRASDRFALLGSYTMGRTHQRGDGNGGLRLTEDILADAFQLSLVGQELFRKGDRLTLGVSQPLRARSGQLGLRSASVVDRETGALGFSDQTVDLRAASRQIDVAIAYSQPILTEGVAFEARAFASQNVGHVAGEQDFGVGGRVTVSY